MKTEEFLSQRIEVCEEWKQSFKGWLNVNVKRTAEISARPVKTVTVFGRPDQNITTDEVEKALKQVKAGKTAGLDRGTTEYLMLGGNTCYIV